MRIPEFSVRIVAPAALLFFGWGAAPVESASNAYRPSPTASGIPPVQAELASLREDVRLMSQRLGELGLTVEQLARQNSELRNYADTASQSYVTLSQMNQALAELSRSLTQASAEQKREIVQQVSQQIERLAKQTQSALDAMAKGMSAGSAPAPAPNFTEDYPKEGVTYTVQAGDSLSSIARKFNSSIRDIQNANKIANPKALQAGQVLFVPQSKP